MSITRLDNFSAGINNVASRSALPRLRSGARYVADANNVDFMQDGSVKSRFIFAGPAGNSSVTTCIPFLSGAIVDCTQPGKELPPDQYDEWVDFSEMAYLSFVSFDEGMRDDSGDYTAISVKETLHIPIPPHANPPFGTTHYPADVLYGGTVSNNVAFIHARQFLHPEEFVGITFDGVRTGVWYVPPPVAGIHCLASGESSGGDRYGEYRFAATRVRGGVESPPTLFPPQMCSMPVFSFSSVVDGSDEFRFYVAVPDSAVYTLAASVVPGGQKQVTLSDLDLVGAEYLDTIGFVVPPASKILAAFQGSIFAAAGTCVYVTDPYRPSLVDASRGIFNFPEKVTDIVATDAGVFVLAGEAYFLQDVFDDNSQKLTRLEPSVPTFAGTLVALGESEVMWATADGFVVCKGSGAVEYVTKGVYTPTFTGRQTPSVFYRDGQRMVTYTGRSAQRFFPIISNPI